MQDRIDSLASDFRGYFGVDASLAAWAPGRVNLIGEHTDYSEGLVLPCAIDRHVLVLAAPRSDRRVRVWASDLDAEAGFEVGSLARAGGFGNYVQGVWLALAEAGFATGGLDLAIASDLPIGSGLSSSAALGLAVVGAVDLAHDLGLDATTRARLAHRGESHFVGVGCGILDPFACALGRRDHVLRIDCRSEDVRAVPFASEAFSILLVHSGVKRKLTEGPYRDRVEACRAAVAAAREAGIVSEEARTLRDLGPDQLPALEAALDPLLFRRARHVISENQRVEDFCDALATDDRPALGHGLVESHRSLRDDYEVSIPELDLACECAAEVDGILGSRLTGAGFGGCTLHLVETERLSAAIDQLGDRITVRSGERPSLFSVASADGADALRLRD